MDATRKAEFAAMITDLRNCRICAARFGFEPRPVVRGKQHAKILQIGQAPSKKVSETLLPFNDPSGDTLKYRWYQITDEQFYDENNFYIASMGHCFPGKNKSGSGDKLPPKICAKTWLDREIALVDNKITIVIGSLAAHYLFPNEDFTELIFKDNILAGKRTFVLPHPSPRNFIWFNNHPEFEQKRLPIIRQAVHEVLFSRLSLDIE